MSIYDYKEKALLKLAEELKASGLRCFVNKDSRTKTYMFVGDDTGVAYVQTADFGGYEVSTVNKPCKECGTGFRMTSDSIGTVTAGYIRQVMAVVAPSWARQSERDAVSKYDSIDDYIAAKTILDYVEI